MKKILALLLSLVSTAAFGQTCPNLIPLTGPETVPLAPHVFQSNQEFCKTTAQAIANLPFVQQGTATGPLISYPCLAGNCFDVNQIKVSPYAQTGGSGVLQSALSVTNNFGANVTGNIQALEANLSMTAPTANTGTSFYVALSAHAATTSADSTPNTSSVFAFNANAFLGANSTNFSQLVGSEIDVAITSTASAGDIIGQQIVMTSIGATLGSRENIAETLNSSNIAVPWDCGWCAGNYSGFFPFGSSSTMIGCWPHAVARNGAGSAVPTSSGCGTTLFGIDLSNMTFAAGGGAFLAPLHTPGSSSETCRTGLIEWDTGFIYICTATNTLKRVALTTF